MASSWMPPPLVRKAVGDSHPASRNLRNETLELGQACVKQLNIQKHPQTLHVWMI